jgi:hypothetical protein
MNNNIQNQKTLDEMINHIAKEKNIRNLLSRYEIANIEEINGIKHYEHDDDRRKLVVDVKENDDFGRTKILIDLRLVKPSIYQLYDALYDIGKDCDIKIIIHTKNSIGFDETNPVADEYAVLSLVTQLQENNVAVGLFEIDRSNMEIEYIDWFQDWYQVSINKSSSLSGTKVTSVSVRKNRFFQ